MVNLSVTVLLPTYKRGHLVGYVLDALTKQTMKNFEVLAIFKPSGDKTKEVLDSYKNLLKLRVITQKKGNLLQALNLGLDNASGEIIVFLDDDAIPFPDWLKRIVDCYRDPLIGGVAGDAISTSIEGRTIIPSHSEIIKKYSADLATVAGYKLWRQPLSGLEGHYIYLSKAGIVSYDYATQNISGHVKSLLGMGANMSVRAQAIRGFHFPTTFWKSGLANEQILGLEVVKNNFRIVFAPDAKVYHINHASLSRNLSDKRRLLWKAEENLLFYRMYGNYSDIAFSYRIFYWLFLVLNQLKHPQKSNFKVFKNFLLTELIGLTWILSKKVGGKFTPEKYLESLQ